MRAAVAASLLFVLAVARATPAAAFSMADVLSAPFVDNVTASPDGSVLVWKVDLRGHRNLYTNAGGTIHKLTSYDTDDGQDIDDVAILPGNDALVYMRGGVEDNAGGENLNPLSLVPPPVRGVYLLTMGASPVQIGEGSQVALSPRGNAVAWVNAGTLNVATIARSASGYTADKAVPLPIRGTVQNPIWSPDGTRIAFTDVRNDHSFVTIYTPSERRYVYASPDFTLDDFAAWSADGTRVAFVRTPGNREDESAYLMPTHGPWSIWVADAQHGVAHMVWQARRGMGETFYPSTSAAQLWWLGENVAFAWEGSGWQNLYAVPARGGAARPLATGAWEAETIVPSLDHRTLFYATNENDIDRRHIWRVGLDAAPRPVTTGPRDQWGPTPLANGDLAYVDAGYREPPVLTIASSKATLVAEAVPASFPAASMVQPRLVTFRSSDGLLVHAQLFLPHGNGRHPAMIFDHGGSQRQMLPGFHYMEDYTKLYESNQYLVNHGYVVLSINYRSGIMYGNAFRTAPHAGWLGASEYQDILAGARYLMARPDVNPKRLGIYGLSYGGYLAELGLARNSDVFKAGAVYAGVENWATLFDWYAGGKVTGTPEQRRVAYDASPIASMATWRSPVFLAQGDDDRNVAFSQGVDLAARLRDRGLHVETMVFPNESHASQVWADVVRQYQAAADFLDRMLK